MNWWKDKQHAVYPFKGIMLNNKTGTKCWPCHNIDGPLKHYAKLKQPLFCNNLKWSIAYKNIESLCCIPETNTIL